MKKKPISDETLVRLSTIDLIKSDDPVNYLSVARLTLEPEHYNKVIEQIERYPYKLTNLLGYQAKKNYKELDFKNLLPIPFDNELTWAKSIIFRNAKFLNAFISSSNNFSSELLRGDYRKAKEILNQIETDFGQSIWLIKNKIALLQITEGLEAQKRYTQNLKEDLKDRSLVKFVVHWISIRNEGKTTLNRFSSQFEPIINRFDPIKLLGFKEYCKYHVLGSDSLNPEGFIDVLRLEYSRSLIDYYEAFVATLRVLILDGTQKLQSKAKHLLEAGTGAISDQRLIFLYSLLGDKQRPNTINDAVSSCDCFLQGDYNQALQIALSGLKTCPDDPMLILIAAHAKAILPAKNTINNTQSNDESNLFSSPFNSFLISNLSEVIYKGPIQASKEINELNKIAANFSCFSWSSIINIILSQETTVFSPLTKEGTLSALKIPYFHPLLLELTKDTSIYEAYAECCIVTCLNSLSIEYALAKGQKNYNESKLKLGVKSENLLHGILSFYDRNYKESISRGKYLAASPPGYFNRKGTGLVTHSFLRMEDLKNACVSTAEFYLRDKYIFPFLPLVEIFNKVKPGSDEWDQINSLIEFPIILDALVKYVNSAGETERRFAYEDFLTRNGMIRPSDLKDRFSDFELSKLVYYLKYICVEAIMDTSDAFEGGSKDIVDERLLVCKMLLEIDPLNSDEYQKEIYELVRRQIIASRRQEVDQSRIYIDITKVKEWTANNLEESFERYIAYLRHGLDFNEPRKKSQGVTIDLELLPNILIPNDEVNALLREIIEEIISAYLSPEFGLDRFLSTRIRHGILEGKLRRPLENHNLITKKEFKHGPYLPNSFWLAKFKIRDIHVLKEITKIFNSFSSAYDNLILKITTDWLQVTSIKKPKGLFDFRIVDEDIKSIRSTITPETTFKEFIDKVINFLESILIFRLAEIKEKLHKNAKPEAKKYLKEFQEKIASLSHKINVTELLGAINQARTDMQAQFDKIIEWFVPSASGNSTPFALEDPFRVAEAIIVEASPSFKINFTSEALSDTTIHGNLPIFVDIFTNIFDNVVKRSGLEIPLADCQIWISKPNSELNIVYFKISNDLNLTLNLTDLTLELIRKKELLETGDYAQYLAIEGNSGLYKIHKSELTDAGFDEKPTFDFGIENNRFQIIIGVPFRVFKLEPEELEEKK